MGSQWLVWVSGAGYTPLPVLRHWGNHLSSTTEHCCVLPLDFSAWFERQSRSAHPHLGTLPPACAGLSLSLDDDVGVGSLTEDSLSDPHEVHHCSFP